MISSFQLRQIALVSKLRCCRSCFARATQSKVLETDTWGRYEHMGALCCERSGQIPESGSWMARDSMEAIIPIRHKEIVYWGNASNRNIGVSFPHLGECALILISSKTALIIWLASVLRGLDFRCRTWSRCHSHDE